MNEAAVSLALATLDSKQRSVWRALWEASFWVEGMQPPPPPHWLDGPHLASTVIGMDLLHEAVWAIEGEDLDDALIRSCRITSDGLDNDWNRPYQEKVYRLRALVRSVPSEAVRTRIVLRRILAGVRPLYLPLISCSEIPPASNGPYSPPMKTAA
jgi:hypothetical protein